jgi:hypothetical protein
MKRHSLHSAVIIALATALSGCLEINTTTRVHPDGRLTRTVVVSGDSSDFTKIRLGMFGLDSGWTVVSDSLQREKERKLTLQREFDDAESASRALAGIPMERQGITIHLAKEFRWFTTHFRFEEIWQKGYLFEKIPISAYLSPEEIQMLRAGDLKGPDSLLTGGQKRHRADLEKRGEEWMNRNAFEEVLAAFLDGVKAVNDPRLVPDSVLAAKDRLYEAATEGFKPPLTPSAPIIGVFPGVLKNPVVPRAVEAARPSLEKYDRAVDFMERLEVPGYGVSVVMPGIITNTNGSSVEGNTVRWKEIKDSAFYEGYTMWAESNMVNWWAVVVTAIVLMGIGALLVAGLVHKR